MAVPDFQSMMLPVLKAMADGQQHPIRDVSDSVAEAMGISVEDRSELLPSGIQSKWSNRIAWVGTHFNFAGLITRPARAVIQTTALNAPSAHRAGPQAGGLPAISQGSSEPSERHPRFPSASDPHRDSGASPSPRPPRSGIASRCIPRVIRIRGYRCAQPPANRWQPSGLLRPDSLDCRTATDLPIIILLN